MLGWEFFVTRKGEEEEEGPALVSWMAGLSGRDWLKDLVREGMATDLGGNGYPCRYLIPVKHLRDALAKGIPSGGGPLVIGDDYAMPAGWHGAIKVDLPRLRALDADEELLVEAWDQS